MSNLVTPDKRGRLLLPKAARDALGVGHGAKVAVAVDDDGSVVLRHERDAAAAVVDALRGIMADQGPTVDEFLADRRREAELEDEKERRLGGSS
jgi:AbrB family looped-hinge helix DNA binding protein